MTGYQLTAGQQQQLINFLNAGKSIYLEGNDFGYYHGTSQVYSMFGCSYLGDSDTVLSLTGQQDTLAHDVSLNYHNATYTNDYTDWIDASDGASLLFKSEEGKGRVVSYAGANGDYRAIHCSYVFGAMKNTGASHTKAEIMAAYMRYLQGGDFVLGVANDISASAGGSVCMGLEASVSEANRTYGVMGSVTGTSPGFHVGSVDVPLNPDPFFQFVFMYWNSTICNNFMGNLNGNGCAAATFDTLGAVDPSFVGVQMHFAYILANPIDYASAPVEVNVIP